MSTNMLRFILLRIPKRTKEHNSARSQGLHSDRLSTAQRSAPRQDRGSLWTLYRAVHRGKSDFVRSMTAKAELLGMNAALLTEVHVPSPQCTKAKLLLIGREEPEIAPLPEETHRQILQREAIYCAGSQDDVVPWYSASDIYVQPSHRGGFCNSLLEAGAMEQPCITYDVCVCNDAVTREWAILVSPYNAITVLAALIRLDKAAFLRQNLGNKARRNVGERFSRKLVW